MRESVGEEGSWVTGLAMCLMAMAALMSAVARHALLGLGGTPEPWEAVAVSLPALSAMAAPASRRMPPVVACAATLAVAMAGSAASAVGTTLCAVDAWGCQGGPVVATVAAAAWGAGLGLLVQSNGLIRWHVSDWRVI